MGLVPQQQMVLQRTSQERRQGMVLPQQQRALQGMSQERRQGKLLPQPLPPLMLPLLRLLQRLLQMVGPALLLMQMGPEPLLPACLRRLPLVLGS